MLREELHQVLTRKVETRSMIWITSHIQALGSRSSMSQPLDGQPPNFFWTLPHLLRRIRRRMPHGIRFRQTPLDRFTPIPFCPMLPPVPDVWFRTETIAHRSSIMKGRNDIFWPVRMEDGNRSTGVAPAESECAGIQGRRDWGKGSEEVGGVESTGWESSESPSVGFTVCVLPSGVYGVVGRHVSDDVFDVLDLPKSALRLKCRYPSLNTRPEIGRCVRRRR